MKSFLFLLICFSSIYLTESIYEDQAGKFDWRKQFIGCPNQVFFDRSSRKSEADRILISSKENVFASVYLNTGQIKWRRIQEEAAAKETTTAAIDEKHLFTIVDGGRLLRVWNKVSGALKWEKSISEKYVEVYPQIIVNDKYVASLSADKITAYNKPDGETLWSVNVAKSEWSKLSQVDGQLLFSAIKDFSLFVDVVGNGQISSSRVVSLNGVVTKKCTLTGKLIVCVNGNSLNVVDVTQPTLQVRNIAIDSALSEVQSLSTHLFALRGVDRTVVYDATQDIKQVMQIEYPVESITYAYGSGDDSVVVAISRTHIEGYNAQTGKRTFKLLREASNNRAPMKTSFAVRTKKEIEVLAVGSDCRLEMLVIDEDKQTVQTEWIREEGLARISNVEMVDLPLSESQQMIEDEFDDLSGNIVSSFMRRVVSQAGLVQKWFFATVKQIISLSSALTMMKSNSFAQLLDNVRNSARVTNDRTVALERDFFNLRKMIVATSLDGVVFGLDSSDGNVVWRLWLGNNFAPLSDSFGLEKIPLFVQRSTAHHTLDGQLAVVFRDLISKSGIVVSLNPISGGVIGRKQLDSPISHVDVLPFTDKEYLHPLFILDDKQKLTFLPDISSDLCKSAEPLYVLQNIGQSLSGWKIDLQEKKITQTWTVELHHTAQEKIIAIKGKPAHQKVHSQGRVLIDREVQYKYSNPNLVAIATLDDVQQVLTIYVLDGVSGQMVHSAHLTRAASPVHMVHCENWIAYSYWSDRSRRTEIGIIELYEGEEISNKDRFESLAPTKKVPEVLSQSYIYAQGVKAMAVSETEQGLTTRSVLLALPFGGIHEVSRKLLDATRPMELTQEMREEMMIPYMPEIPIATEEMVNYNQTVHSVQGIKIAPSGLESTSLLLAYGMDLFFTRLNPSGTFDILKDDFDHLLISLVLFGLIAGSIITKKLSRNSALKSAWA